jgi:Replication protein
MARNCHDPWRKENMTTVTPPPAGFSLSSDPPPNRKKKPKQPTPKREKRESKAHADWAKTRQNAIEHELTHATEEETSFRHEHWKAKRDLVRTGMLETNASRRRLESFNECGAAARVEYEPTKEKYRIRAQYCKNRNCEPCMRAKANLLAANLEDKVEDLPGKQFRFITLTLRHTNAPLSDQLDRLNACFKKLRNHHCWKSTQDGGAAMLEVKWERDSGEWHPHMHIVSQGFFLPQKELSDAWYAITKDSFKVDIRVIKSPRDAARYVAKYVSKGINDDLWLNQDARQEWIIAMRGRRLCATFGCWRGFKLLGRLPDTGEWKDVGDLYAIVRAANRNERWAINLLDILKREIQYDPHRKRQKKLPTP